MYITEKDDFSRVPEALLAMMGKMEFVMDLQLSAERQLASEDAVKVMGHLLENGYFVQLPRLELTLN